MHHNRETLTIAHIGDHSSHYIVTASVAVTCWASHFSWKRYPEIKCLHSIYTLVIRRHVKTLRKVDLRQTFQVSLCNLVSVAYIRSHILCTLLHNRLPIPQTKHHCCVTVPAADCSRSCFKAVARGRLLSAVTDWPLYMA